eukprot:GHVU01012130.1.p1 GENE.GHVU01012130.1~~GHVU01012130.1.p1  ORF type:complete len:442 (+),score=51.75 GHVU01012130.1:1580-2905(+)
MMESPVSADIGKLPLKEKVRLCFRPQTFFDGSDEEGNSAGRYSSSGVFGHRVSAASREEDVAIAATDAVVEEVHRICERRKGGAEIEREGGEVTSAEEDRRPEPWDDSHPVLAAADDDVDDAQAVAAAGATRNTATKDVPLYLLPFLMELLREGLSSDDSQERRSAASLIPKCLSRCGPTADVQEQHVEGLVVYLSARLNDWYMVDSVLATFLLLVDAGSPYCSVVERSTVPISKQLIPTRAVGAARQTRTPPTGTTHLPAGSSATDSPTGRASGSSSSHDSECRVGAATAMMLSCLRSVQCSQYAYNTRSKYLRLLTCILTLSDGTRLELCSAMGRKLITEVVAQLEGERDPRNLMLVFPLCRLLLSEVCVCVCVCMYIYICVCVCVCVCERSNMSGCFRLGHSVLVCVYACMHKCSHVSLRACFQLTAHLQLRSRCCPA